jgi:hypothetical protein
MRRRRRRLATAKPEGVEKEGLPNAGFERELMEVEGPCAALS